MDELGHILREARENKGLTLEEAQESTRINARYLNALETGQYDQLPTPVHVRGFLRNYARFLGLDPAPLLERYRYNQTYQAPPVPSQSDGPISAETPLPSRGDQPFFDPVNVEVDAGVRRDPESAMRIIIIIALLVALALIANRFVPLLLNNEDGSTAITAAVSNAVDNVRDSVEEQAGIGDESDEDSAELDPADVNATLTAGEFINDTGRTTTGATLPSSGDSADTAADSAVAAATRPALPATMEEVRLLLEVTERTWMEVTIDDEIVFSGIARGGDTFEWTAAEEAKLLTGNAAGILATVNETDLGRLGERGENKEEVWRTTN